MIVLVKTPEQQESMIKILNGKKKDIFKQMQEIVGGYIEQVKLSRTVSVLCNEDGKPLGLPYNCSICGHDFVGTIIIVGTNKKGFCDIDLDTVAVYKAYQQM